VIFPSSESLIVTGLSLYGTERAKKPNFPTAPFIREALWACLYEGMSKNWDTTIKL